MRIMAWGLVAGLALTPAWCVFSILWSCNCGWGWSAELYLAVSAPMLLGPLLVIVAGAIWDAAKEAAELEERFP